MQPNQLYVDMDKEVVFAPINGQPVPLSIHTIKNVTQPDPDNHCHYLRINFFTSGAVSGKGLGWGPGAGPALGGSHGLWICGILGVIFFFFFSCENGTYSVRRRLS